MIKPSRCLLAQILSFQSYYSILRARTHAHTHTPSLSLSLSPCFSLSLYEWVCHTHIHTHTHILTAQSYLQKGERGNGEGAEPLD